MRMVAEREVEKEWRWQEKWETWRQENKKSVVIKERNCFGYREFKHIMENYGKRKEEKVRMQ